MYALEIGTVYLQMKTMLKIVFFAGDKNEILELAESSYIYKYILLFCSHSLVFKCQPDCSNQDQHFFKFQHASLWIQKKFQLSTKLPLFRKRFYPNTLEQATFLPPDSDFCMLPWNITVCYFPLFADWFQSFLIFFFLNLSVFYAWALFFCEHLSIWHSRGVVLLMRPGDYALPGDALIPVSHIQHRRLLSG